MDLSKCPNLKEVDATGSTFTNVEIADNAPVTTIKLNNPTSLSLSNLTELETLSITNYGRLKLLNINEDWLYLKLKEKNILLKDVYFASYENEDLYIVPLYKINVNIK